MFVDSETGVTFGRGVFVPKDHAAYPFVMEALRDGDVELATRQGIAKATYIAGVENSSNGLTFCGERISPLLEKILIKYICLFEKENLLYTFILPNFVQQLLLCQDHILNIILENRIPITEEGKILIINYEDELINCWPKDWNNFNLHTILDDSVPQSILYRQEFGLRGAL